jgi:hypothetical protein
VEEASSPAVAAAAVWTIKVRRFMGFGKWPNLTTSQQTAKRNRPNIIAPVEIGDAKTSPESWHALEFPSNSRGNAEAE